MSVIELIEKHAEGYGPRQVERYQRFAIKLLEMVKAKAEAKCTPHSKGSHVAASYAVEIDNALEELRNGN